MIRDGKARVNISLDNEVLKSLDEYARLNGISRSGAISVLCMQMIQNMKAADTMKELKDMYEQLTPMLMQKNAEK